MSGTKTPKATSAFTPFVLMHFACFPFKVPLRSTKSPTICFLRKLHDVNVAWQQNTRHTLDTETISSQYWSNSWRPQLDQWSFFKDWGPDLTQEAHHLWDDDSKGIIAETSSPQSITFLFLFSNKFPLCLSHAVKPQSCCSIGWQWRHCSMSSQTEFCDKQRRLAFRGGITRSSHLMSFLHAAGWNVPPAGYSHYYSTILLYIHQITLKYD